MLWLFPKRIGLKFINWELHRFGDCNLNCVSKEKNIIFTNTVFL